MTSYVKVIVSNFILIICESFKNVHNYFKLKVKKIWIFMTQETYNTALGPINHLHKKGKVAFKSRGTLILLTFQEYAGKHTVQHILQGQKCAYYFANNFWGKGSYIDMWRSHLLYPPTMCHEKSIEKILLLALTKAKRHFTITLSYICPAAFYRYVISC